MNNNNLIAQGLLEPYLRALIKVQNNEYPQIIGSGFIVKDDKKLFLVTAAHLFDHYTESTPIYVNSANDTLVLIEGISQSSKSEDGVRKNDHVDISIIYLNEKCSKKLAGISFLEIKFKLVSVLIEYHQKVHQTIVTTRIKNITKSS